MMRLCDVTQFYSPLSGGVKRYISEKQRFVRSLKDCEHILIIPGNKTTCQIDGPLRVYTVRSPKIDKTSRYRIIFNLLEVKRIIEIERPDFIECGDPYHVAWAALEQAEDMGIPVSGFYHSHFPDAYLRTLNKHCGRLVHDFVQDYARRYISHLYNRFDATLVPSPHLRDLLASWGVQNALDVRLGVNTESFRPAPRDEKLRRKLGIAPNRILLLNIGRLAHEKNTATLVEAFRLLHREEPNRFHLCVIGEGPLRPLVTELAQETGAVFWRSYLQDSAELARFYHSADLFVHPGVCETFGLVTVEAQACGVPVVGIRGSYMDRLVFEGLDSWASENSAASLARAIRRMAVQPLREMGERAASIAIRDYDWNRVLSDLFEVYASISENKRRGGR